MAKYRKWGCACDNCEDCSHNMHRQGSQRGVMDCDPDEDWCEFWNDYYYGVREYDEETEEEFDCEDYSPRW